MKVSVDQDLCISCGACIDLCPSVFGWNDEGLSHVTVEEVPEDAEETAKEAVESCPTDAIKEIS
ncbi:MAG: ferredoxin [Clostridia bacterium]|nr:ferredoxin [Clostridia bacterium]